METEVKNSWTIWPELPASSYSNWPLKESEAGVGLLLVETFLLFLCKLLLNYHENSIIRIKKQQGLNHNMVIVRPGH